MSSSLRKQFNLILSLKSALIGFGTWEQEVLHANCFQCQANSLAFRCLYRVTESLFLLYQIILLSVGMS